MEFTKHDIAQKITRPVGTIKHWTDKGYLSADVAPASGKGRARLYSFKNLIQATMIDHLNVDLGIPLNVIDIIFSTLSKDPDELRGKEDKLWKRGVLEDFGTMVSLRKSAIGKMDFMLKEMGDSWDIVVYVAVYNLKAFGLPPVRDHWVACALLGKNKREIGATLNYLLSNPDMNALYVFKIGALRNRAMKKHNITWADSGQ